MQAANFLLAHAAEEAPTQLDDHGVKLHDGDLRQLCGWQSVEQRHGQSQAAAAQDDNREAAARPAQVQAAQRHTKRPRLVAQREDPGAIKTLSIRQ